MRATPTAPPIVRENWFSAVIAPRSSQPTTLWIMISRGVLRVPIPAPMTRVQMPTQTTGSICGWSKSMALPHSIITVPASASRWYPTRIMYRPAMIPTIDQPKSSGARAAPAS